MRGSLPTFIIIGSMKCGTTSLHRYLGIHPHVCVSSPKETNFFLERNDKSVEWYRGCFEGEAKAYGEASPNYTKYPGFSGVPKRIHNLIPNAKLVYLVRDPIERAISYYMHNRAAGRETNTIREALLPVEESGYLNSGRYYFQLSQYLEYYSMEDILVIQSERLREHREDVMEKVFRFVGVDPHVVHERERLDKEHHTSSEKKRKTQAASFLTETALGRTMKDAGKQLVPQNAIDWMKEQLYEDIQKPIPSEDVLSRARAYLREDVEKLRALTEKEFSEWSL